MAKKKSEVIETVTTKTVKKTGTPKSINIKISSPHKSSKKMSDVEMQKLLVENFVGLQRTMADMAVKFNGLSDNISKLLTLFEISAKSFAEKQSVGITTEDKEFLEKLDKLLEQNKLIAKGLTMMEERVREKMPASTPAPAVVIQQQMQPSIKPAPEQPNAESAKPKQLPRF
ncbi:MAG: hypothetical protein WC781_01515 [Candidatus Pacearchaeota archaeon]